MSGAARAGGLRTEPRLDRPDDLYEVILDAHRGLSDEEAWRVTAKLALLLANHVGDLAVVREAAVLARARPGTGRSFASPGGAS